MKDAIRETANELHRGITMHRLPVGAGFPGLVFTVGSIVIFLIALPSLRWFAGLALMLGLGVAVLLRLAHHSSKS